MNKNIKISILIILCGFLITSFIFYKNKNISNEEDFKKSLEERYKNWEEISIENLDFLVPEETQVVDKNHLYAGGLIAGETITLEKTKLSDNEIYDNIEDWYQKNQERSSFWVRFYKIYDKESGKKLTPVFVMRDMRYGEYDNAQWVRFIDKDQYFYNITIRNFNDDDLDYFLKNIKLDKE
jgi:hypothetical protein